MSTNECYGSSDIEISFERSVVHVPFNVYAKDRNVVQGADFSKKLDAIFKANTQKGQTLSWQYFASNFGYTRFYPALQWRLRDDIGRPIDYDARFEPWYIASVNYPKELIIVLDASGSMKGFRQVLAILTIRTVIATLSDRDYFTVIYFNDKAKFLHPCFQRTLARATDQNKSQFMALLQNMETKSVADFPGAILKSYETLAAFRNESTRWTSASRAIMFMTDGVLADHADTFELATDQFGYDTVANTRIFTYLIGKDLKNSQPLRSIACTHRGYFSHIASTADVKENVMQYFHVMNRQLATKAANSYYQGPRWSQMYAGSMIGGQKMRELVLSSTVAAYNSTKSLLGVGGTDIPVSYLRKYIRPHELGPNGYAFLMTKNGYVTIHPRLKLYYDSRNDGKQLRKTYRSMSINRLESLKDR